MVFRILGNDSKEHALTLSGGEMAKLVDAIIAY